MIYRNEKVSFGQPIIQGRRLTVFDVVAGVYYSGLKEYSKDHELDLNQIKEAFSYCCQLKCQDWPSGKFCSGCILSTLNEGWNFNKSDYEVSSIGDTKYLIHKATGSIFLGTLEEYEKDP